MHHTTLGFVVLNLAGNSCNGKCDFMYRGLRKLLTCCTEFPIELLNSISIRAAN